MFLRPLCPKHVHFVLHIHHEQCTVFSMYILTTINYLSTMPSTVNANKDGRSIKKLIPGKNELTGGGGKLPKKAGKHICLKLELILLCSRGEAVMGDRCSVYWMIRPMLFILIVRPQCHLCLLSLPCPPLSLTCPPLPYVLHIFNVHHIYVRCPSCPPCTPCQLCPPCLI